MAILDPKQKWRPVGGDEGPFVMKNNGASSFAVGHVCALQEAAAGVDTNKEIPNVRSVVTADITSGVLFIVTGLRGGTGAVGSEIDVKSAGKMRAFVNGATTAGLTKLTAANASASLVPAVAASKVVGVALETKGVGDVAIDIYFSGEVGFGVMA